MDFTEENSRLMKKKTFLFSMLNINSDNIRIFAGFYLQKTTEG
jgi:hypothetical protein